MLGKVRYHVGPRLGIPIDRQEVAIFRWDEQALSMVTGIENVIIPLDHDCQGQFISLTNAMEMQLESGAPAADVVRLIADAVLALAKARRLPKPTRPTSPRECQPSTTEPASRLAVRSYARSRFHYAGG